ncbi:MAG TPA: hypothetical protein DCK83_07045 [Gallionellaceae bacterium]|nr:hypothetical protein [Gallionellaceae bacterium]
MARKATTTTAESHVVTKEQTPAIDAAFLAANQLAVMKDQYSEDRDLANQMLGQIQMSISISKFTTVVGLSKLREIKESKLYKALAGKTIVLANGENTRLVGTWAEYCELLGTSANKIDEDLMNLRVFGEDAMESLTRIGAGYRELRQLRKLPEDQQAALIEVAKLGDKDSFIELAEEIIAKHAKEKEELTKAKAELQADYEAQGTIIRKKDEKLNSVEKQLHKLQNRAGDWHPRATEIAIETTRHAAGALEALDKLDAMRDAILTEEFGEEDRDAAIEAMAVVYYDGVSQIAGRLAEVMAACEEVFIGYKEKARPMLDVEAFQPKASK